MGCTSPGKGGSTPKVVVSASSLRSRMSSRRGWCSSSSTAPMAEATGQPSTSPVIIRPDWYLNSRIRTPSLSEFGICWFISTYMPGNGGGYGDTQIWSERRSGAVSARVSVSSLGVMPMRTTPCGDPLIPMPGGRYYGNS